MDNLSLHILDVAENSINAGAKNIEIRINEDLKNDKLTIEINDDGAGMDEQMAEAIKDPFITSRTTRKVGLGIPMLKEAAEMAGGDLKIESRKGYGTKVKTVFQYGNIDRKPLSEIEETIISLILFGKDTEISFNYRKNEKEFEFNTNELKKELRLETLNDVNLLNQLKEILKQKINEIQ
jgi:anti-sigma regulatory factor (Ser/Thr protein kinase)